MFTWCSQRICTLRRMQCWLSGRAYPMAPRVRLLVRVRDRPRPYGSACHALLCRNEVQQGPERTHCQAEYRPWPERAAVGLRVAPDEDQQQTHADHQVGKYLPARRVPCVEHRPGEQPTGVQQGLCGQGTKNNQYEAQQRLFHGISLEVIASSTNADRASLCSIGFICLLSICLRAFGLRTICLLLQCHQHCIRIAVNNVE